MKISRVSINNRRKEFEISTNGQAINDNLERIFQDGIITRLVVSCDGEGTPSDYERLRPPATWEKLNEFLGLCRSIRKSTSRK